MNDIQTLTHPQIIDAEALLEFADALAERVLDIERDMAQLGKDPENRGLIADIFRSLHNIKGDAALCSVATAALIAHPLESLLTRMRTREVRYTQLLGEVILLGVDRLELAIKALMAGRSLEHLKLVDLVDGLKRISVASQGDIRTVAAQLIKTVTGFQPQATLHDQIDTHTTSGKSGDSVASDLLFFRSIALQFETRSPLFVGRTDRLHQLAMDANRTAGSPVDTVQLEAALYLHDLGMMFMPESVWLKFGKMSDEERVVLHAHPDFAAGLLARMEGWGAAAQMVRQHHETWDGKGYPAGLKGNDICQGAQILSIVDAFESVMLKLNTRSRTSCILRAIAEVNACEKQFAPEWIAPFNSVVRIMLER
jgi:HD-GYP domain-containing protein (c-di-GMP phosphodiesterase class II)